MNGVECDLFTPLRDAGCQFLQILFINLKNSTASVLVVGSGVRIQACHSVRIQVGYLELDLYQKDGFIIIYH